MTFVRSSALIFAFFLFLTPFGGFTQENVDCAQISVGGNKRFVSTALNLRANPSGYGEIFVTLPVGEVVYEYRTYQSWSQVNVASLNITGFVATRYLSKACIPGGGLTRKSLSQDQVTSILISSSLNSYGGNCPCPYNVDRAGRRCGGRSAYTRPGGRSPLCYPSDITSTQIDRFRNSR